MENVTPDESNIVKEDRINNSSFDSFPELRSKRLVFRKIDLEDVEEIFKIYSDPEVAKYDWYNPIENIEDAISIINGYQKDFQDREEITWGIARKSDNKIIGYCCLGDFNNNSRRSEIGYGIMGDQWNKGYGTEAVKTIVKFGFEIMNLNRIEATVTLGNHGSIKVLKKSKFTSEGIFRQRTFMKGEFVDDVILAILKKDYI